MCELPNREGIAATGIDRIEILKCATSSDGRSLALDSVTLPVAPGPRSIACWRHAKQSGVLAAELRRTFIADREADAGGVSLTGNQQTACFLQTNVLLVLQWTHGRDGLEMAVQC